METVEIPTKEEAEIKIKALCMKLLIVPEHFTLGEVAMLQELLTAEGFLD